MALPIDAAQDDHLGIVGVVPRRHDGLQVLRLGVVGGVRGDPVEGGVEEGQLVVEPGVGVAADAG